MPADASLAPLLPFAGHWRGSGRGTYPTVKPFRYDEEIDLTRGAGPFLRYEQRTRDPRTGDGMHTETGYWRPGGAGSIEIVIAQPTGITEVHEGTIAEGTIHVVSVSVGLTRSAKPVRRVERTFRLAGDELTYVLLMEAVGMPHQLHLEARLARA